VEGKKQGDKKKNEKEITLWKEVEVLKLSSVYLYICTKKSKIIFGHAKVTDWNMLAVGGIFVV